MLSVRARLASLAGILLLVALSGTAYACAFDGYQTAGLLVSLPGNASHVAATFGTPSPPYCQVSAAWIGMSNPYATTYDIAQVGWAESGGYGPRGFFQYTNNSGYQVLSYFDGGQGGTFTYRVNWSSSLKQFYFYQDGALIASSGSQATAWSPINENFDTEIHNNTGDYNAGTPSSHFAMTNINYDQSSYDQWYVSADGPYQNAYWNGQYTVTMWDSRNW